MPKKQKKNSISKKPATPVTPTATTETKSATTSTPTTTATKSATTSTPTTTTTPSATNPRIVVEQPSPVSAGTLFSNRNTYNTYNQDLG